MTLRNILLAAFALLALVAAAIGYAVWHYPDSFPRPIRAMLDERRLSLLVGDLAEYERCFAGGFTPKDCERWRVTGDPTAEFWPYGRPQKFEWPAAPQERVYRPGMDRVEYFKALCLSEAGEFITKTVRADGIYMIRPRREERDEVIRSRYGVEDPYGYGQGDVGDEGPYSLTGAIEYTRFDTPHYAFVETPAVPMTIHPVRRDTFHASVFEPPPADMRFRRFDYPRDVDRHMVSYLRDTVVSYQDGLTTRYGYIWREIRRPYDREFGIAGGELAVIDLQTGEVLGLRRGFMLASRLVGGGVSWLVGPSCPWYSQTPELGANRGRDKDSGFTRLFLTRVVVPENRFVAGNR